MNGLLYMKNHMRYFVFVVILLSLSCETAPISDYEELSLLDRGFPITIMAPDSVKIKVSDLSFMKDITIQSPTDPFDIQILVSDNNDLSSETLFNKLKVQAEENPYFKQILKSDEQGFIFENSIDSLASYDFRYFNIKAGKEYIFQTGLSTNFGLEEVENMYEAVAHQHKKG